MKAVILAAGVARRLAPLTDHTHKCLLPVGGRDGSGVLKGTDGQPFRFKLTYPTGSANYEHMVLVFKDAYAAAARCRAIGAWVR